MNSTTPILRATQPKHNDGTFCPNKIQIYEHSSRFFVIGNLVFERRDRCTVAFSITKLKCVPMTDRVRRAQSKAQYARHRESNE